MLRLELKYYLNDYRDDYVIQFIFDNYSNQVIYFRKLMMMKDEFIKITINVNTYRHNIVYNNVETYIDGNPLNHILLIIVWDESTNPSNKTKAQLKCDKEIFTTH